MPVNKAESQAPSSSGMYGLQSSNGLVKKETTVKKELSVKKEPIVKQEPLNDSEEEQMDEVAEGLLAEHEGVQYYEDEGFKIKQVIEPMVVNRVIFELYRLSRTKYLKLDPEYQRDVVWDETRSSGLIASLLQGYFIPPIIFNVIEAREPDDNGVEKVVNYRICVDGKQRLTSVKKFLEGEIGVPDSCTPPKKWYYSHPIVNGVEKLSNHNILPEATKAFFRRRTFCCYEYQDLQESVEETMFQLVQRGMPLTPAERMRALSTPWANFAKQYEADYPNVVNLSKQGRASGFRAVMTIFCQVLEVLHPSGNKRNNREGVGQKPVLQASPQVLTRLILDEQSLSEGVKAKMKEVFDKYQELVDLSLDVNPKTKTGFKATRNSAFDPAPDFLSKRGVGHVKTFSPVELLATAILLLMHKSSRQTKMLIGDIKEMRHYLREHHKDLRLNNICWATAWEFIDVILIQRRGGCGAIRKKKDKRHATRGEADDDYYVDDIFDYENDIVGPTTARQRALAAKNGYDQLSQSNGNANVDSKPRPEPVKYFASATPRGALADPNAPAFRAFENPNPLAIPRFKPPPAPASSAQDDLTSPASSAAPNAPATSKSPPTAADPVPQMSTPKRRDLELDLGQAYGVAKIKIPRTK